MRRIPLSILLLLACSLVLAACGSKSSNTSSKTAKASSSIAGAEMVPASAIAFVSVNTDSTGAQWQQAKTLITGIPAAQKALASAFKGSGVTLADVEQALGSTTDIVEFGSAAKPLEVILTNPADSTKLKGMLATSSSKTKPVTTTIGSWLAIADTQAALDQLQSATASGKLADSSTFKEALAGVPADAFVKAYLTGTAVSGAAKSLNLGSASTKKMLSSATAKNALEWGTLSVSAVPEGFSVSGVFKSKTGSATSTSSPSLINELPSATSFAVELNGKDLGLDKAVLALRKNAKYGKQIPQIEAVLGIKLEDLAALAGSEMSIYGTTSGIGLLINAPDAGKSKTMLDKVTKLLSAQLSGASKPVTIGGVAATSLKLGTTTLYYGVKNGNLFIVTDANALPGAGISSDPVYAAAAKALPIPASNSGVAYVDFANIAQLAKSGSSLVKSASKLGGSSTTKMSTNLDVQGISSLLGYIVANGDKLELNALLSVK
jgi:hypothetical protein